MRSNLKSSIQFMAEIVADQLRQKADLFSRSEQVRKKYIQEFFDNDRNYSII